MLKENKITLVLLVLIMSLGISYLVVAWEGPPGEPTYCPSGYPGCDAPLDVGPTHQAKEGGVSVNSFVARAGAILAQSSGNVGIGRSPSYKLDVQGDVRWSGILRGGTVPWARLSGHPSINAGTGLTGGGTLSSSRTINVDTNYLQRRVSSTCSGDQAIRAIGSTGSVTCVDVGGGGGITSLSELNIDTNKNWAGRRITNLGSPSASSDAATKGYVDAQAGGGISDCVYEARFGSCPMDENCIEYSPTCPSGYHLTGGGHFVSSTIGGVTDVYASGSFPTGDYGQPRDRWRCHFYRERTGALVNYLTFCYAICCR